MFFSVHTLGCKLNQLESEAITDAFSRGGFNPVSGASKEPGIIIINTCTVTSMAEQKARRLIRKLLKDYPAASLIITGCYAQMDKEIIEKEFPERVFVLPGESKDRLLDLPVHFIKEGIEPVLASFFSVSPRLGESPSAEFPSFRFRPEKFSSHSRGFMKIQDGCDRHCTYCRVSLARGKSRSLGAKEVLSELISLEERGFNEAVLTGVNITQYKDTDMDLAGLLEFLLKGTRKIRLRLSSIDPDMLSEKLFSVLADKRIRPHFHLSLQSGSTAILDKMGRAYTPPEIEKTADRLRSVKDDPFLACDIIAAFPGETEDEFEETRALCERTGFSWIHAFPFSPRPGTAACNFPGRIPEREAKRRVEILTKLAVKGRLKYLGRWKGREVEAIIEAPHSAGAGKTPGGMKRAVPGVSENYLKLLICGANNCSANDSTTNELPPAPGSLARCRILEEAPKNANFDALAEFVKV